MDEPLQNAAADVDQLVADLTHPMKPGLVQLRAAILASDPEITEQVKWNAPSFRFADEDRVTFRLHPKGLLQLVFHRGAKVRADSATFAFEDDTGLMDWAAADRAVVTLKNQADVEAHQDALVALVNRWVRA